MGAADGELMMSAPQRADSLAHIDDVYPLTGAQAGILFHALRDPESTLGFEQVQIDIDGAIVPDRLQAALDDLVIRHPVLRTHLLWDGLPAPLQVVRNDVAVPITVHDHRDGTAPPDLDELAAAELAQPFDLSMAPLLRVVLVCLPDDRARLIWNAHHVLLDGWSTPRLLSEWFARYDELTDAGAAPMPPATPFRDYLAWLTDHDREADDRYWATALAEAPPARLPLPPAASPVRRVRTEHRIAAPRQHDLVACGRASQATLGTILLFAWGVVVADHTSRTDHSFATAVSGRPPDLAGVEEIAGMMTANVPVVCRLDLDATLGQAIAAAQHRQNEASEHQTLDLGAVARYADNRGEFEFDHLVIVQGGRNKRQDGSLDWRLVDSYDESSYAMDLFIDPSEEILVAAMHDENRLSTADVAAMIDRFELVLATITEQPKTTVGELLDRLASERLAVAMPTTSLREALTDAGVDGSVVSAPVAEPFRTAIASIDGVNHTSIPAAAVADPERLARAAQRTQADWIVSDGAALAAMLDRFSRPDRRLPGLRGWLLTEPIDDEMVTDLAAALPEIAIAAVDDAVNPSAVATPPGSHVVGRLTESTNLDPATHRVAADGTVFRLEPHPPRQRPEPTRPPAPTDATQTIIDIWRSRLDVDRIGPDDDFFTIGGTSLTAVAMLAAVADQLNVNLPLRALVAARTPQELAALVRSGDQALGSATHLVALAAGDVDLVPTVMVHGAGGNIVGLARAVDRFQRQPPTYGIEAAGVDGIQLPHASLEALLSAYEREIDEFVGTGEIVLAGYSGGGTIAHSLAARREARGLPVRKLVLIDTFHPDVDFSRPGRGLGERLAVSPRHIARRFGFIIRDWRLDRALARASATVADDWTIMPFAVRERQLGHALSALTAELDTPDYRGPAEMIWTTTKYASMTQSSDRGWDTHLPQLVTRPTPGAHLTLFENDWLDTTAQAIESAVVVERPAE